MSRKPYTPLVSSQSRVFLIEGRARPDHAPDYQNCLRMAGISQSFGDIETIECPDPDAYGQFIEIAEITGAEERATTTLEGRYALDLKSTLLKLAQKKCSVDVQLHMGACTNPADFTTFTKAIVLESARLTAWNTEDLGVLASGDNASVNETADISAKTIYEVRPLTFTEQAGSIVTNEVLDVVIADSLTCGDCEGGQESDGCFKIYAISLQAGGSPTTPADIVFSTDKGANWYAHDIDTLGVAEDPNAISGVGSYIVVVSNDSASLHYVLKVDLNSYEDPAWTEVTTGFVAGGEPNDIWSSGNHAFIVGDGGYVYETEDPTAGVTVLDAGAAVVENLLAVHGLSDKFAVAVGEWGAVIYTEDGTSWTEVTTRPVGAGVNLNTVWVKSENEWWVGTSTGRVYYTFDKGDTWTEKTFPGSGSGVVYDIVFPTDSVGYIAHTTAAARGRILRTFDGGYQWVVMPESGTLPLNDRVNALGYCSDANFIVGTGLGDNGSDGYIVLGQNN